ncbi:MAG: diguanylate cyclase [Pseudomonadota bacterium]
MKILVADDERVSRMALTGALENWGYEVTCVEDGTAAWAALQAEGAPSLAIIDWMMPGMDGVDVCRKARAELLAPYVYFIMLTSKRETAFIVQAMDAGADDFITKPFELEELKVRVRAGRRIVALHQELERRAVMDALTGIWNRGAIMEGLDRELSRRRRSKTSVAVVMLDVDHFKRVNDTHGHPAGDQVLCEVSRRIASGLRPYDVFGRYGGEEFLIVLPQCQAEPALEVAQRLRLNVGTQPITGPFGSLDITVSVGVALIEGDSDELAQSLLERADAALYRAKGEGRNRVVVSAPTPPPA